MRHLKSQRRWECEWTQITNTARRRAAADPDYEFEFDRDMETVASVHVTKDAALAEGRTQAPTSAYGCAIIEEQRRGKAGWAGTGERFEVDAEGETIAILRDSE